MGIKWMNGSENKRDFLSNICTRHLLMRGKIKKSLNSISGGIDRSKHNASVLVGKENALA